MLQLTLAYRSSGYVLDEPLRQTSSVMLACTDTPTSTPCVIHLNCQRLKGYYPVSIRLTSGSRTVECYTGIDEEYAGTSRGTLVDRLAHAHVILTDCIPVTCMYCCMVQRPEITSV